jgi:hypothetical protein
MIIITSLKNDIVYPVIRHFALIVMFQVEGVDVECLAYQITVFNPAFVNEIF